VVLRTDMFELIQYTPQTTKVRSTPLLIVPPTINKYYVIDLAEERSLVEHLVKGGQQVYCISWRNPDVPARRLGRRRLRAGDHRRDGRRAEGRASGPGALLGICSGGCWPRWCSAPGRDRRARRVAAFSLAVTVLDQQQAGLPSALLSRKERGRRRSGRPGEGLPRRPEARRAVRLAATQRPDLELLGQQLPARPRAEGVRHPVLERDPVRMSAAMHRDFMELAISNGLTEPGGARMLGTDIDLRRWTRTPTWSPASPTTCAVGVLLPDHAAPRRDTKFVLSTSGHIAAMVNPPGNPKASFQTASSNPADPKQWLERRRRSRAPGGTTTWRGWTSAPGRSATSRAASARPPSSRVRRPGDLCP
jgi:poly(3-hydroxyalkanoate) synthetase